MITCWSVVTFYGSHGVLESVWSVLLSFEDEWCSKLGSIDTPSKWTKVSRVSHVSKMVNNMLIKCFIACIIDLKSFGGQTSNNMQDVQKLVFTPASEYLYVCLIFIYCLELRSSVVFPSNLIDMLRVKMSRYDSQGTTRRAPKKDSNLGQGGCLRPWAGQNLDFPCAMRA